MNEFKPQVIANISVDLWKFISSKFANCVKLAPAKARYKVILHNNDFEATCYIDKSEKFRIEISSIHIDTIDFDKTSLDSLKYACDVAKVLMKMDLETQLDLLSVFSNIEDLGYTLHFNGANVEISKLFTSTGGTYSLEFDIDSSYDEIDKYLKEKENTIRENFKNNENDKICIEFIEFVNNIAEAFDKNYSLHNFDDCNNATATIVHFKDGEYKLYLPLWDSIIGLVGKDFYTISNANYEPKLKINKYDDESEDVSIVFNEEPPCEFTIEHFAESINYGKGCLTTFNFVDLTEITEFTAKIGLTVSMFNYVFSRPFEDQVKLSKVFRHLSRKYIATPNQIQQQNIYPVRNPFGFPTLNEYATANQSNDPSTSLALTLFEKNKNAQFIISMPIVIDLKESAESIQSFMENMYNQNARVFKNQFVPDYLKL